MRVDPPRCPREARIVAYDLETTPIAEGTPAPLYFTAYDGTRLTSLPLRSYADLAHAVRARLFTEENIGAQLVAWNGNRYDLRLVLCALVGDLPDYAIKLFCGRDAQIRAAYAYRVADPENGWQLVDGLAMTGARCTLRELLDTFAPATPKLDADVLHFDPEDPQHRAYAERDAVGLWHAITNANRYARELTGWPLTPTIGRLGMRFLQSRIPHGVKVWRLPAQRERNLRRYATRGGFTWTARPYRGPLFQYDMNQAYGAAAKYARLPCGNSWRTTREDDANRVAFYRCTIARRKRSPIPFYVKVVGGDEDGAGVYTHGNSFGVDCWLASIEVDLLRRHGWNVQVHEGYVWFESFALDEAIDVLEVARSVDPNGPRGEIAKALGCNLAGKTLEQIPRMEYVVCSGDPGGTWLPAFPADPELRAVWCAEDPDRETERIYHRPQIGAIITAQVRCWMFDAAMRYANVFVKADTDSLAFSVPVPLPLHATRYGAWKLQVDGQLGIVISHKAYAVENGKRVAGGLDARRLAWEDYERWFAGAPPVQVQTQLQGWKSAGGLGTLLFRDAQRTGIRDRGRALMEYATELLNVPAEDWGQLIE